jgi:hypothetical protein
MPDFAPPAALIEAAKAAFEAVSLTVRSRRGRLTALAYAMTKLYHEEWNSPEGAGLLGATYTAHEGEDYYIQIARCTAPADAVKAALLLLGNAVTITPDKPFVLRYLSKSDKGDVYYKVTLEVDAVPPPPDTYQPD